MNAKEQKWEQKFLINGEEKTYYPRSEEQRDKNAETAKKQGFKQISCKKLYPFSIIKNQHNFFLISNVCENRIYDILHTKGKYNARELDELEALQERADRYMAYCGPVAWVPWEIYKDMKYIAEMAISHRAEACIRAGHANRVQYC